MRERNLKIPKTNKALRPLLEPARTRASRKPKHLQPKRQKIQRQKGLTISYYIGYHLWSLLTSIGKITHIDEGEPPQKDGVNPTLHLRRALVSGLQLKHGAQESTQSINHPRNKSIESWISACAHLVESEELLESPSENMLPNARAFTSRLESKRTIAIAPSNRSKVGISVGDSNFSYLHNIFIIEDLPTPLLKRAKEILSKPHESSEMDKDTALKLKRMAKRLATENEYIFIRRLGESLFPTMREIIDKKLVAATNELWNHAVAIPVYPFRRVIPPPFPRPKPDLVFGYSGEAFDKNPREAFELPAIEELKQSYAIPVKTLRFPFLQIEFKAFATRGNPFVAENQAANAGAIAMNGLLELNKRNTAEPNLIPTAHNSFL